MNAVCFVYNPRIAACRGFQLVKMAFISEIHYQNSYASGSTVPAEYVEISLSPADFARAGDFVMATYQSTGDAAVVVNLGTLTPVIDPDNGFYVYTIFTNVTSPDHTPAGGGEAEAVALVDTSLPSPVLEFYDIGGGISEITATDGPAVGQTSTNIPASPGGTSIQFDAGGNRIDGTVTPNSTVVCFCAGTLIATPDGPVPIEDLGVGDLVRNAEGDDKPIRWIGVSRVDQQALSENPKLYPVRFRAGALGAGLPKRDLLVSRQHRMLVCSRIARRVTGTAEVLVAAIKMTALRDVFVDTGVTEVRYFHILFDQHEIIYAEGAATESLFTGPEAMKAVSPRARAEILVLFPDLAVSSAACPARPVPSGKEQSKIVARHAANTKALQDAGHW